jgi:hypothetical protein
MSLIGWSELPLPAFTNQNGYSSLFVPDFYVYGDEGMFSPKVGNYLKKRSLLDV